jgi:hypothetical protein
MGFLSIHQFGHEIASDSKVNCRVTLTSGYHTVRKLFYVMMLCQMQSNAIRASLIKWLE